MTIVQRFFALDALTQVATPADPTTVVFTIVNPDGTTQTFSSGVASNITNPEVGLWLCELDPQLPAGDYAYRCEGSGALVAAGEGTFTVLESGVLPPVHSTVADYGPCSGWIDGSYVDAFDDSLGVGSSVYLLDAVAEMGSQLMYELSARQFPGVCRRTVRPCRSACSCFGFSSSLGLGPWSWASSWGIGGWGWQNECGDSCGCGSESYVKLAGYPVAKILEVKIDGIVLDPATDYRLDGRRNLIRLPDLSGPVPVDRFWPVCQDLSLPDTEPGTYSVTYEWGGPPMELGKQAAAQIAVELWKASPSNQGECRLPAKVTRIVRAGVTLERVVPLAELLRSGATGLPLVDAFIALVNPQGARRRSLVWSPDVDAYARKVGQ